MRILYVITKADIGGAQTHLIQIANHFTKKHQVIVAVGSDGPMIEKLNDTIKVVRLKHLKGPINLKEDILGIIELKALFKALQPDLIHLHSSKAGTLGRAAIQFNKKQHAKVVFTAHSWAFTDGVNWVKQKIFKAIEQYMLAYTDQVICVSEFDKTLAVKNHFNQNKLITIHNSVSKSENNVIEKIKQGCHNPVKFVMVARFAYPKLQRTVIEAADILRQANDRSFEITFIGNGVNYQENFALTKSLQLDTNVHFITNQSEAKKILKDYDVLILMSKHEGLPISVIEAMSEGLPIIASDVGGISELVFDNGRLIKHNTPEAMAEAMAYYLKPSNIKRDAIRSFERYNNQFTEDKMLEKLECVYEA